MLIELGPKGASAAYFVMDERVMRVLLADPHTVVSSDGSPSMLHPRGYGSFARVIRRYVVEEGVLSIEEAVRILEELVQAAEGETAVPKVDFGGEGLYSAVPGSGVSPSFCEVAMQQNQLLPQIIGRDFINVFNKSCERAYDPPDLICIYKFRPVIYR